MIYAVQGIPLPVEMAAIYRNLPDGQEDRRRAQEAAPRSVPDIFYFKETFTICLYKYFMYESIICAHTFS